MPQQSATGEMTMDGFDRPITLKVKVSVEGDRIVSDFTGSSGLDKKGINCPLVYAKAYACYALKVAIAPEIPNNAASLAPFEIEAPENSIVNALHPAPVALRHIVGILYRMQFMMPSTRSYQVWCQRRAQAAFAISRFPCVLARMRQPRKMRAARRF